MHIKEVGFLQMNPLPGFAMGSWMIFGNFSKTQWLTPESRSGSNLEDENAQTLRGIYERKPKGHIRMFSDAPVMSLLSQISGERIKHLNYEQESAGGKHHDPSNM